MVGILARRMLNPANKANGTKDVQTKEVTCDM